MRGILALVLFLGFYQGVFAATSQGSIDAKRLFEEVKSGNKDAVIEIINSAGGNYEVINGIRDSKQDTLLIIAVVQKHIELIKFFISKEADVSLANGRGYTALHEAANIGHLKILNILLDANAEVDAATSDGKTALHLASYRGHADVCERLIAVAGGAKETAKEYVNTQNAGGFTALHNAADKGHLAIINNLLEAKADVAALTNDGKTALHLASYGGHTEVCEQLIAAARDAKGVDAVEYVNILNANGFTALHNAIDRRYRATAQALFEAGAYISVGTGSASDKARDKKMRELLRDMRKGEEVEKGNWKCTIL